MPIATWEPVLKVEAIRFVSVQQRRAVPSLWRAFCVTHEPGIPPAGVEDLGLTLTDWAATGDLLSDVDLVITCDTGLAHLAGSLGRPVWILLNSTAGAHWDIYWEFGERTPWYPTARLFRQQRPHEWAPGMHDVAAQLEALVRRSAEACVG